MSRPALTPSTTYPAIVGQILARRRVGLGRVQQDLAKRFAVTVATWSRMETGELAPTVEQLARAAELLETTPGAILTEADRVAGELEAQGWNVSPTRIARESRVPHFLAGVALAGLVAAILSDRR